MSEPVPTRPLVVCGADAGAWTPQLLRAVRARDLPIIALDGPGGPYTDSPLVRELDRAGDLTRLNPDDLDAVLAAIAARVPGLSAAGTGESAVAGVAVLRDKWVATGSWLAELLAAPGLGLRAGRVCGDKYLQRFLLDRWSPRWRRIEPNRDGAGEVAFPAVVKPIHGTGSAGVVRVDDAATLDHALEAAFAGGDAAILVEDYVNGPEFSVETIVRRGRVVWTGVTAKTTGSSTGIGFVEIAHTVGPASADEHADLLRVNAEVMAHLGLGDGAVHSEYRLGPNGPIVMEVNGRLPGGNITTLHSLATGVHVEDAIVAAFLGEAVHIPPPRRWARQGHVDQPDGELTDVQCSWPGVEAIWLNHGQTLPEFPTVPADAPPALRAVVIGRSQGELIEGMSGNKDRVASYLIDAPTLAELDALDREAQATVQVVTAVPDRVT